MAKADGAVWREASYSADLKPNSTRDGESLYRHRRTAVLRAPRCRSGGDFPCREHCVILWSRLSRGQITITQQLARNFFLSPEKTLIRKIKEVFLAIRIEQLLSKDEILELYLNKIYRVTEPMAWGCGTGCTSVSRRSNSP